MRIRNGLGVLICCCAGLGACTAAPKGPDTTVTTPAVGRPPAPVSAQAALSSEAFTPYAGLGAADNDGLAPGDTYDALHTACMNDAGYGQYAAQAPYSVRTIRCGHVLAAGPRHPWAQAGPGAEPFRPARRTDPRAEPGADRDGRGRRELHAEQ